MMIRNIALILLSLAGVMNCYADSGSVVFGSWQSLGNAENGLQKVQGAFGVDFRILPTVVNGENYHRVASQVLPEGEARALIDEAASKGYRAWYLRTSVEMVLAPDSAVPRQLSQKNWVRSPKHYKPVVK